MHAPARRPALALSFVALAVLVTPSLASAADAAAPPVAVETMAPTAFAARHDDVAVRTDPGFVYRQLRRLAQGEQVMADGRSKGWLRVVGGGWVAESDVMTAEESAAAARVTRLVVTKDGARVRATPAKDGALVATLQADAMVTAVAQEGEWWQLDSGGWIHESLVTVAGQDPMAGAAARATTADRPLPWVVAADAANVRAQGAEDAAVVRRLQRGEIVLVSAVVNGWAQLRDGWVRLDLLQSPGPRPGPSSASKPAGSRGEPRRWSLMDLNGVVVEVYEIGDDELVDHVKRRMRDTKVMESDWTFLGITIGVPADASFGFNYSPEKTPTIVLDAQGQRYGNVYPRGPLQRMPADIREALEAHEIMPGERYSGLLLFRPTLRARDIARVSIRIGGRPQRLMGDK